MARKHWYDDYAKKWMPIDHTLWHTLDRDERDKWIDLYMRTCTAIPPGGLVKFHREKLGRQDHCMVTGSQNRRFYIWIRETYSIWVHNVKGLIFYMKQDAGSKEVWRGTLAYLVDVGLDGEVKLPEGVG